MVNALPAAAGLCELWRLFGNIWFNLFMEPRHFLDVTGHGSRVAAHDLFISLLWVSLSPVSSGFHYQTSGWEREQSLWRESTRQLLKRQKIQRFESNFLSNTLVLLWTLSPRRHFSECNFPMQCYKSFYHFLWERGTAWIILELIAN